MKQKLWHPKKNYAMKTINNKEQLLQKDSFLLGCRATFSHQSKQSSTILGREEQFKSKESKFDQLKRQIKNLENSQFRCLKYRCHTEPDFEEVQHRNTNKDFMPGKKIAQLQKYKMHLRKKGNRRKISLLIDKQDFYQQKQCNNLVNCLQVTDTNTNKETSLKKKETPSIVKKYYRPHTGQQRSLSQLNKKEGGQNEVRGRALKSSATNRCQKENVLIYCY